MEILCSQKEQTIAQYFEKKHWSNDLENLRASTDRIRDFRAICSTSPFSLAEYASLRSMKNNKRPDGLIMELSNG